MAVITYRQEAVLGAYQSWLMQQGAQACLDRIVKDQDPPGCANIPGTVYAQAGSSIRYTVLTTLTTATVFFSGSFQADGGSWNNVAQTVVGTSAGGVDRVTRPATPGCYRTMVATVGEAVVGGAEVYVLAELGRTDNGQFVPYALLLSGYIRSNEPIDMGPGPGTKNPPSSTGGGTCVCPTTLALQGFDIDPGLQAASATRTPAAGTKERIIVAVVSATMGAAVANRALRFDWRDVTVGQLGWIRTPDVLTASSDYSLNGYVETPVHTVLTRYYYLPLPQSLYMTSAYNMFSDIEQFQAGDSIDDTYAVIEITSG